jgi:NitT/TauT family transport system permease protein/taurine transport system permease protein
LDWARRSLLPFALLVVVWWSVKLAFGLNSTILPSPWETVSTTWPLVQRGILNDYITASLSRMAVASLLGIVIGLPIGLLLGSNRYVAIAFSPILNFFQALSGIAWLPLMLVWFGFGETTIQAVILYTVLFPVAFNTMTGVRTVPIQFANALRVLGAGRMRMIVGAGGIGFLLFQARSFHETARIMDGMILIGLLWILIDLAFLRPVEAYTIQRWGMVQR